ncbi:glycerol-3-phosphate dehydrogenase (NAD(P)+) [Rhizobium sp. SG_E_25_P2]|uniref:glycerol-3-phosphate dehydrogenase n=1 Tax=Rhizobium sp. SG_E_25_P2 TaxID=2879942 RepID=UPI0024733A82|nr:glycerol-3-phosphate dehydrogenase [Rhizobium sp. SG_E_25_P2]MDH6266124.1 glycerol-3-phosphate dehydrogenase (NAD(P)+) [Rhizobium sp. SG_E_25_P2]
MAKIVIIGAGVMGSALSVPAADNDHSVTLVGSPLDDGIIDVLRTPGGVHPKLDARLPDGVRPITHAQLQAAELEDADVIVAGVSSPGIGWFVDYVGQRLNRPKPIAFVTKGLDLVGDTLATYADTLPHRMPSMRTFIGIGGPCIARELANRLPTLSIYGSADHEAAKWLRSLMQTPYYRLATSADATGLEACAALKNFYAIGVSAMQTRYPDDKRADGQSKNPCAGAFSVAVREMTEIAAALGGDSDTAVGLAGLGDLHVTVGGGRNSRLGHGLGSGRTVADVVGAELSGETVEGVDTACLLARWLEKQDRSAERFPLASAIIMAVLEERAFSFDFATLHLSGPELSPEGLLHEPQAPLANNSGK